MEEKRGWCLRCKLSRGELAAHARGGKDVEALRWKVLCRLGEALSVLRCLMGRERGEGREEHCQHHPYPNPVHPNLPLLTATRTPGTC